MSSFAERGFWSRRRAVLVAAVVVVTGAVGAVVMWRRTAPPPTGDTLEVARFVGSDQFEKLPEEEKGPYLEAVRKGVPRLIEASNKGELSDDDHLSAVGRAMGDPMRRALDEYFALPKGPERERYLDRMINEQEKIKREPPPTAPKNMKPVQFKRGPAAMDSQPPEQRARMAELMGDLNRRREARGLGETEGFLFRIKAPN